MFNYERLLANARPRLAAIGAEAAASELRQHEIRFLSNDKAVRLPARGDALVEGLRHLERVSNEGAIAKVVAGLTNPDLRVPLTTTEAARKSTSRRAAVGTICVEGDVQELVLVELEFEEPKTRFESIEALSFELTTSTDPDDARERLEELFLRVPAPARRVLPGTDGNSLSVAWLGGRADGIVMPYQSRDLLAATAAVRGAQLALFEEPGRRPKDVLTELSRTQPDVLALWVPHAARCEEIASTYSTAAETLYLPVTASDFEVARLELRLALDELAIATRRAPEPPAAGEERFYTKVGGSKTGDRMVYVADCGHAKWGDDARQRAPRARMGIEAKEGVSVSHLALCGKCGKHRWRARF